MQQQPVNSITAGFLQNYRNFYLGLSQKKLQIPSTEDTMVFHIAWNILRTRAVYSGMHFHVCVNNVQVDLLVLRGKINRKSFSCLFYLFHKPVPQLNVSEMGVLIVEIAKLWQPHQNFHSKSISEYSEVRESHKSTHHKLNTNRS